MADSDQEFGEGDEGDVVNEEVVDLDEGNEGDEGDEGEDEGEVEGKEEIKVEEVESRNVEPATTITKAPKTPPPKTPPPKTVTKTPTLPTKTPALPTNPTLPTKTPALPPKISPQTLSPKATTIPSLKERFEAIKKQEEKKLTLEERLKANREQKGKKELTEEEKKANKEQILKRLNAILDQQNVTKTLEQTQAKRKDLVKIGKPLLIAPPMSRSDPDLYFRKNYPNYNQEKMEEVKKKYLYAQK